jgi:hypothetical protein
MNKFYLDRIFDPRKRTSYCEAKFINDTGDYVVLTPVSTQCFHFGSTNPYNFSVVVIPSSVRKDMSQLSLYFEGDTKGLVAKFEKDLKNKVTIK